MIMKLKIEKKNYKRLYQLHLIELKKLNILLVKHYFSNNDAGLYSSLALIGRVVYFVAWMFVMLLLISNILCLDF